MGRSLNSDPVSGRVYKGAVLFRGSKMGPEHRELHIEATGLLGPGYGVNIRSQHGSGFHGASVWPAPKTKPLSDVETPTPLRSAL